MCMLTEKTVRRDINSRVGYRSEGSKRNRVRDMPNGISSHEGGTNNDVTIWNSVNDGLPL